MYVTNTLDMNSQVISAAGMGFRGGGGVQLGGAAGGSNTYFRTQSANPYNGSKGEGIAGMPRFINNNGVLLDNGAAVEGYLTEVMVWAGRAMRRRRHRWRPGR